MLAGYPAVPRTLFLFPPGIVFSTGKQEVATRQLLNDVEQICARFTLRDEALGVRCSCQAASYSSTHSGSCYALVSSTWFGGPSVGLGSWSDDLQSLILTACLDGGMGAMSPLELS